MIDVNQWLSVREWYDNHKLSTILNCQRKGWLHLQYQGGLAAGVGPGANFGTCIHEACAVYYKMWTQPEQDRRIAAYDRFSRTHQQLFPSTSVIANKHTEEVGLDILDYYFNANLMEDKKWCPIENELASVVPINPQDGDPPRFTKGFYFVVRLDGLWERLSDGTWFTFEIKTTGTGVDRELTRRVIDRQSTGYVYAVSQFPGGERVQGTLFSVIGVFVGKRDCKRDVMRKNAHDLAAWRLQTINIVCDWRERLARAESLSEWEQLQIFYQNDEHCTAYGLCPYFPICSNGLQMAKNIGTNVWTPFKVINEPD